MNMQSSIIAAEHDSIDSVHQLLVVALALVDELGLPGRIGADIDLAIHSAQSLMQSGRRALLIS